MKKRAGKQAQQPGEESSYDRSRGKGLASLFRAKQARFATTRWTLIAEAGGTTSEAARVALEQLCQSYWYPLYAYVRRRGHTAHEAEDLTQEFFYQFLMHESLARADPQRGKFRSYLLGAMKHFLDGEWRKAGAQKRGGHQIPISLDASRAEQRYQDEPADLATPEALYDRRWAWTLIEQALEDLRLEMERKHKAKTFEVLKDYITLAPNRGRIADLAERLERNEGAVRVAIHRMRKRFRKLLRARIEDTVGSAKEVDVELGEIFNLLSG